MPARKPTRLKALSGTLRPGRTKSEPQPAPATLEAPEWLGGRALEEWDRVAPELAKLGLLTVADVAPLAGYCTAYGHAVDAEIVLERDGLTFSTPTGYVQQRPEVSIARSSWEAVRKFAAEFGLSPAARGRIEVPEAAKPADPLEEFLAITSRR